MFEIEVRWAVSGKLLGYWDETGLCEASRDEEENSEPTLSYSRADATRLAKNAKRALTKFPIYACVRVFIVPSETEEEEIAV